MIWRQTMSQKSRGREAGQTVMVAALAMIPLLMMVGLVVDGGFALANQRRNQNAADAAANAGAVLLMENLPFGLTGQPVPRTDADVENAVVSTATTNGVDADTVVAYYTDIEGDRLDPEVEVGSLGTVPPPTDAYGVEAEGSMSFGTFFAGIAGFADLTTGARATAVTGTPPGICSATEDCGFIPVTFPTSLSWCDGNNKQDWGSGGPYTTVTNPDVANEITIPLCGTEAGSVGWLDILPNQDRAPATAPRTWPATSRTRTIRSWTSRSGSMRRPEISIVIQVQDALERADRAHRRLVRARSGQDRHSPALRLRGQQHSAAEPRPPCPNPPQDWRGDTTRATTSSPSAP